MYLLAQRTRTYYSNANRNDIQDDYNGEIISWKFSNECIRGGREKLSESHAHTCEQKLTDSKINRLKVVGAVFLHAIYAAFAVLSLSLHCGSFAMAISHSPPSIFLVHFKPNRTDGAVMQIDLALAWDRYCAHAHGNLGGADDSANDVS